MRNSYIDEIDKKIIEILEKNARTPFTKIAKLLNISESAVRKRVKKLEDRKIIKGYKAEINYKNIGYKIVWVGLDVKAENIVNIIESLKNFDEIKNFYLSSGDHDIMIEFIYKEQEELNDLIKKLEKLEGVTRICPAILIEKI